MITLPNGVKLREFYSPDELRDSIFDRVKEAYQNKFPLENDSVRLELEDLDYDESKKHFSYSDYQKAVLTGGRLSTPLKGRVRLIDKETEKTLDEKEVVLANVPYLTADGTFVVGGNHYTTNNQARLRPGVYARTKDNGELESHINVRSGTGPSMRIFMEPETGVFRVSIDKSNIKLYPVLSALGVDDDTLRQSWGDEILESNRKAWDKRAFNKFYSKFLRNRANPEATEDEKRQAILDRIVNAEVDPEVTERTLGKPYDRLSPEVLISSSQKLLRINRGEEDEDDRDHPANRTIHSADDFLVDRVKLDAGKLGRQLLYKTKYDRSLRHLRPGYFTPQLEGLIISNQLSQLISGINPVEMYDQHKRVIQIGEGGVSSMDSIPMASRNLHAAHLGMLDPIRSSESKSIGVDQRFTRSALKGSDNQVYFPLRNRRTGKIEYLNPMQIATKGIAFPQQRSLMEFQSKPIIPEPVPLPDQEVISTGTGIPQSEILKFAPQEEIKTASQKEAIVERRGDKFVLLTKDKSRVLGTHDKAQDAYKQEYAIQKSQEQEEDKKKNAADLLSVIDVADKMIDKIKYPNHQFGQRLKSLDLSSAAPGAIKQPSPFLKTLVDRKPRQEMSDFVADRMFAKSDMAKSPFSHMAPYHKLPDIPQNVEPKEFFPNGKIKFPLTPYKFTPPKDVMANGLSKPQKQDMSPTPASFLDKRLQRVGGDDFVSEQKQNYERLVANDDIPWRIDWSRRDAPVPIRSRNTNMGTYSYDDESIYVPDKTSEFVRLSPKSQKNRTRGDNLFSGFGESSPLINTEREVGDVIGHELGHAFLGPGFLDPNVSQRFNKASPAHYNNRLYQDGDAAEYLQGALSGLNAMRDVTGEKLNTPQDTYQLFKQIEANPAILDQLPVEPTRIFRTYLEIKNNDPARAERFMRAIMRDSQWLGDNSIQENNFSKVALLVEGDKKKSAADFLNLGASKALYPPLPKVDMTQANKSVNSPDLKSKPFLKTLKGRAEQQTGRTKPRYALERNFPPYRPSSEFDKFDDQVFLKSMHLRSDPFGHHAIYHNIPEIPQAKSDKIFFPEGKARFPLAEYKAPNSPVPFKKSEDGLDQALIAPASLLDKRLTRIGGQKFIAEQKANYQRLRGNGDIPWNVDWDRRNIPVGVKNTFYSSHIDRNGDVFVEGIYNKPYNEQDNKLDFSRSAMPPEQKLHNGFKADSGLPRTTADDLGHELGHAFLGDGANLHQTFDERVSSALFHDFDRPYQEASVPEYLQGTLSGLNAMRDVTGEKINTIEDTNQLFNEIDANPAILDQFPEEPMRIFRTYLNIKERDPVKGEMFRRAIMRDSQWLGDNSIQENNFSKVALLVEVDKKKSAADLVRATDVADKLFGEVKYPSDEFGQNLKNLDLSNAAPGAINKQTPFLKELIDRKPKQERGDFLADRIFAKTDMAESPFSHMAPYHKLPDIPQNIEPKEFFPNGKIKFPLTPYKFTPPKDVKTNRLSKPQKQDMSPTPASFLDKRLQRIGGDDFVSEQKQNYERLVANGDIPWRIDWNRRDVPVPILGSNTSIGMYDFGNESIYVPDKMSEFTELSRPKGGPSEELNRFNGHGDKDPVIRTERDAGDIVGHELGHSFLGVGFLDKDLVKNFDRSSPAHYNNRLYQDGDAAEYLQGALSGLNAMRDVTGEKLNTPQDTYQLFKQIEANPAILDQLPVEPTRIFRTYLEIKNNDPARAERFMRAIMRDSQWLGDNSIQENNFSKVALLVEVDEVKQASAKITDHADMWDTRQKKFRPVDVQKLIQVTKDRPSETIAISKIWGGGEEASKGFSEERLANTDTKYPILVDEYSEDSDKEVGLVDGRHRKIKLLREGNKDAKIIRLTQGDLDHAALDNDPVFDAYIITGNPDVMGEDLPKYEAFYNAVAKSLENKGLTVGFDPGLPRTLPPGGKYWIGHSRGADRLRFAPEGVKTLRLDDFEPNAKLRDEQIRSLMDELGVDSLTDIPFEKRIPPTKDHYTFNGEMEKALANLIRQPKAVDLLE